MAIGPRLSSHLAVTASRCGEFWFGKSNKELLTSFADTVRNLTGENVTYECVLQKLNDIYNRYTTWEWVTKQPGLYVDVKTIDLIDSEEDNPSAVVYKFKPEKYSIQLDIIFGSPLKVAKDHDGEHVLVNEQQQGTNLEVIDISDDDSYMVEVQDNQPIDLVIIEDSSAKGPSTTSSIPSQEDTYGYSSASSPYPHNAWKK